ncbi:unnamed protein product [Blepharisma stoltei]|uniref:Uncharacterized protein n=1 Tax=Blepharisma stoltei TaxID=1481888 RepID=A0AAU9JMI5_9CILI|nr:unnamed protein product [Blepharisma stoltei]
MTTHEHLTLLQKEVVDIMLAQYNALNKAFNYPNIVFLFLEYYNTNLQAYLDHENVEWQELKVDFYHAYNTYSKNEFKNTMIIKDCINKKSIGLNATF